ncbi:hypothetical protein ACH6EH_06865 [Paenibacillus sp. JSM ZJ436]|uniref:hypothetical protein n=1 Tax=Paenibacillus sp. JSM ZJ436 TaxID=3376190 RepID=UPI0037B7BE8A
MKTVIKYRDSHGNTIMSVREEKIKTFNDVTADIINSLAIVGVVVLIVFSALLLI